MKDNFQIAILVVFIAAGVFGVLVFSGTIPIGKDNIDAGQGTVVIWGTMKSSALATPLEEFNKVNKNFIVRYEEKSAETFNQDLLEALASGVGPDLFFLPDNLTFNYKNKITTIPYNSYPAATFKTTFAGAGDVFATTNGILAFPITVDPLVMYYSRSVLDANNVVSPPIYWDEFIKLVPLLTEKDESNKIKESATALGQFSNVAHAKGILTTLFMQAGNPIITEKNGLFSSVLGDNIGQYNLNSILKFYTDFADPLQSVYSWNKSFPNSALAFSAENLAFYFGYASELQSLVNKNPNQNFFIAPIPQIRGASFKLTGGRVTGVAILTSSNNFDTAFIAANLLANSNFAKDLAKALNIAPARRDFLGIPEKDAYTPIIYSSALFARSWLDPSSKDTDDIFRVMIENVLANNLSIDSSIRDASARLGFLLIK